MKRKEQNLGKKGFEKTSLIFFYSKKKKSADDNWTTVLIIITKQIHFYIYLYT